MTTPDPEAKLIAAMAQAIKDKCTTYGGPVTEWHEMAAAALAAFRKYPNEDTPTDDPKVKELLEAAREVEYDMGKMMLSVSERPAGRLFAAIAAFDPPKPKPKPNPPMPEWDEFKIGKTVGYIHLISGPAVESVSVMGLNVTEPVYNAIREATAKD